MTLGKDLFSFGIQEKHYDELDATIIELLEHPMPLANILKSLTAYFEDGTSIYNTQYLLVVFDSMNRLDQENIITVF